jgi:hypothetical protein
MREFRALLPHGGMRRLAGRGRVLQDPEGQPTRIVGMVQDITERRAAEEVLLLQALHDPLTRLPTGFWANPRTPLLVRQVFLPPAHRSPGARFGHKPLIH